MDLFEQGKTFAQQGQFEEALDAFILAQENDKENPDIHFYLGLCYSSLEEFRYARYHYDMALTFNPDHQKTRLVYGGLKDVDPEKPPERKNTRKAAAKARKTQSSEQSQEQTAEPGTPPLSQENRSQKDNPPEDVWEKAFPLDEMNTPDRDGILMKIVFFIVGVAVVALIVFFALSIF